MPGHAAAVVLALTAFAPIDAGNDARDGAPASAAKAGITVVFAAGDEPNECLAIVLEPMPSTREGETPPAVADGRPADLRMAAAVSWRFGLRAGRPSRGSLRSLAGPWPPDRATASAWRAVVTTCQAPPWAPTTRAR